MKADTKADTYFKKIVDDLILNAVINKDDLFLDGINRIQEQARRSDTPFHDCAYMTVAKYIDEKKARGWLRARP